MAREFIYYMHGLTKSYGGGKKVLDNIHLQFYPDAKIGVLGPNGSGKSTLLRIMAGMDKEFTGEAWLAKGATVGYLAQEPELDPSKDVLGNVMDGVAKDKALIDRYNELMMDYSEENAEKAAKCRTRSTPRTSGISTVRSRWPWTRCAARRAMRTSPSSRAASGAAWRFCRLLLEAPDLILLDEPTNHLDAESVAWLEKHLREFPGAVLIITTTATSSTT